MLIRAATLADIPSIHELGNTIWWDTYEKILPAPQIEFMLEQMYSTTSLKSQLDEGIMFILAEIDGRAVGFASYSQTDTTHYVFKIHKLYLATKEHGKGIGKQLLNFIKFHVISQGGKFLELNVNRNNPALAFYVKAGFHITKEIDIPYHGYTLNDYVMQMPL